MKRLIALMFLTCTIGVGCTKDPQGSSQTTNTEFNDELLFTIPQGYTVHRFEDCGAYHYFVTPGPSEMIEYVPEGKYRVYRNTPTVK